MYIQDKTIFTEQPTANFLQQDKNLPDCQYILRGVTLQTHDMQDGIIPSVEVHDHPGAVALGGTVKGHASSDLQCIESQIFGNRIVFHMIR